MKYIVIGLGYFGSKLASNLTSMGHEVIGIDNHYERLDELKDSVNTVMKMDATNVKAVSSLPLSDVDAVIVAIGEDVGSSILTASILKNLNVKRIIARAINQVHHNILSQIGIEEVVLPLEDSAEQVSSMLQFKHTLRMTELSYDYAVAEINLQPKYAGHSLESIDIQGRFNLKLVAVKVSPAEKLLTSVFKRNYKVELSFETDQLLGERDILVVAGKITDIRKFTES